MLFVFYQIYLDDEEKISKDRDEHEQVMPLDANHDKASQAPSLNASSMSASETHRAGIHFEQNVYIKNYIAQCKSDHNMQASFPILHDKKLYNTG